MKAAGVVLVVIGWAALTGGTGYAVSPGQSPQEVQPVSSSKPAVRTKPEAPKTAASADDKVQRERRPSRALASRGNSIVHRASSQRDRTQAVRPAQQLHVNPKSTTASGRSLQQASPLQPAGVQKSTQMHSAEPNMALAARSGRGIELNAQLSGSVQHRGTNPPAIGGIANASRANASAIDGTAVRRKP